MSDNPAVQVAAKPAAEPVAQAAKVEAAPVETWDDGTPFDAKRAKELISKLDGQIKELKPLAKKAADLEVEAKKKADAELSEVEKLKKHTQELEAKVKENELREMRRAVGFEYKLPAEIAELLPGSDLDAMKAKAAELAKVIPKSNLSPTNPSNASKGITDDQRRAFMAGGPLPT